MHSRRGLRFLLAATAAALTAAACSSRVSLPFATASVTPTPTATPSDVTISTSTTALTVCFPVVDAQGDQATVRAGNGDLGIGTEVVLVKMQGMMPANGLWNETAIDDVGAWAMRHVADRAAGSASGTLDLTLDQPLSSTFPSSESASSQLCTVPVFQSLTIAMGAVVGTRAWDGASGGVIALHALGTMRIDGDIDASGRGFRGGANVTQTSVGAVCQSGTAILAEGGEKGEGILRVDPRLHGRGYYTTGGGGGNPSEGGGGGGANGNTGGAGGEGTSSAGCTLVAGQGGVGGGISVAASGLPFSGNALLAGGGGGGGSRRAVTSATFAGSPFGTGGSGGGIVLLIASNGIGGSGRVLADGEDAPSFSKTVESLSAAGGGGAGGTIFLDALTLEPPPVATLTLDARGGAGGSITIAVDMATDKPGGGGGGSGGRVILRPGAAVTVGGALVVQTGGGPGGIVSIGAGSPTSPPENQGAAGL